ncbi:MAG: MBL fold metallo-hydrolase [Pseudomonadota bacterium]
MSAITVRILTENLAHDMVWLAEWGFSCWIRYGGHNILFDTGFSDVWVKNAAHAGIDLETVDAIALSHFHRDHTRGLLFHPFTTKRPLLMHPRVRGARLTRTDPDAVLQSDADYDRIDATYKRDFDVRTSREPFEFFSGAFFLGEIERVTSFEKGCFFDDPMEDDTGLAFKTANGCVVVSGCSHAGICNICEQAKRVTGQPLRAVIGGFHLLHNEDPPVDETIAYFRGEKTELLAPMHCIDFDIQARFVTELGTARFGSGALIALE